MVLMGDQPSFGVLIDSQEAAMDTYETLDDGTLVGTGLANDRDDDQVLLEDLDLYVMEHQRVPVNIFVTVESLSKLFVQALGFPLVANVAGGFLAGLARYSDVIRRWLGIAPGVVPENDLANWLKILRTGWMDPGTPKPSSAASDVYKRQMRHGGIRKLVSCWMTWTLCGSATCLVVVCTLWSKTCLCCCIDIFASSNDSSCESKTCPSVRALHAN